jgi:putative hydrolase of the HAD superfamily
MRKASSNLDMYRIALDISQADPARSVYIDDRALFVEIAQSLGINGIHHTNLELTRNTLKGLGLSMED